MNSLLSSEKHKADAKADERLLLSAMLRSPKATQVVVENGIQTTMFWHDDCAEMFHALSNYWQQHQAQITYQLYESMLRKVCDDTTVANKMMFFQEVFAMNGKLDDVHHLCNGIAGRHDQKRMCTVLQPWYEKLMTATANQSELLAEFQREIAAIAPAAKEAETEPLEAGQALLASATTAKVWDSLKDTHLMELVQAIQMPTSPMLPLEVTLTKALVLAGAAAVSKEPGTGQGVDLLGLNVNTGGGQATNVYGLIVARSGSGKDIGAIFERLARKADLLLGTSGSSEGMQDALMKQFNGIISISEFEPYLKEGCWQSAARPFLTDIYSRGFFKSTLSTRGKSSTPRESNFCFPSLIANIQPEIVRGLTSDAWLNSGFCARFLVGVVRSESFYLPATIAKERYAELMTRAEAALAHFKTLRGAPTMPASWHPSVASDLKTLDASQWLLGIAQRTLTQVVPKIACVLQADGQDITEETFRKARLIGLWYLRQSWALVENGGAPDPRTTNLERLAERIYKALTKRGKLTRTQIAHNYSRGSTAMQRNEAIAELLARGIIEERGKDLVAKPTKTQVDPEPFEAAYLPRSEKLAAAPKIAPLPPVAEPDEEVTTW
jgi:hypothetical protein